jgi:hypothetical protein
MKANCRRFLPPQRLLRFSSSDTAFDWSVSDAICVN